MKKINKAYEFEKHLEDIAVVIDDVDSFLKGED